MSAEGSGHQATPDKGRAGEDPCHQHACPETLSGLEQTGAAGESPHIKTESEEPHPEETLQEDRVQGTHSWAPLSQGSREKAPFLPARALPCPQVPLLACQGKTRDRQMAAALLSAWTQMPVTFEDVALYLSQEEWGRLDHAQQNCYRDILQRTTGLSLGPGSPTEAYHHQTGTLLPGFLWADPSGPPKFRPRRRPPACTHTLKMRQEPYTGGRRSPPLPWRPLRMQSPWGAPKGSAGRTRMRGRWIPQRRDPRGPPQRMRPRAARAARRHPRARPAGRPSAASSAVKASAGTRTWPRTGARTRARSPTPARTAASASAAARTSSSTRSSTRARSPTPARPAGRASATTPRSSSTSASTRARNPTCANAAPSASRAARTWSRTRAPTRAPSRTSARCAPSASRRARRSSRTSARTPASSPTRARSAASASASAPTSSRTTARTRARSPTTASTAARASATART